MNTKKILITIIIFLIFIIYEKIKSDTTVLASITASSSYTFITKWGSKGSGNGEFGGPHFTEALWFKITDNTIESLNKKIDDKKLETLKSMLNTEFDRKKFFKLIKDLELNDNEIRILMEYTAMDIPGSFYHSGPIYLALDNFDNVYVSDIYNNRIEKFDSKGNFILKWGAEGERNGEFNSPVCIAVDNEGDIYVSDIWNDRIQKFNNKGEFITKLDFHENYYTFLIRPTGITVGRDGYIYLVDEGSWIRKFSSSGNLIKKWMYKTFNMTQSQQIVIDSVGYIYILSTYQTDPTIFFEPSGVVPSNMLDYYSIIQKYDPNGNFADIIKKSTSRGSLDGQLADRAWGMAIDSKDNIYVADTYNNRIQKFDSKGNFITKYGTKGNKEGEFNLPIGIAVNKKGEVYVVDSGNYRIQKFAPVP